MKDQKEPLFDDHQVKKTKNKPNTTKKSSWLYSDQKNAQIFRLRSQIECFWQTYWINKQTKNYGLLLIQQSFNETLKQRTKPKKNITRKNQW